MAKFENRSTRLSPQSKFKLGQRIAIKQPYSPRIGQIVGIEAETTDIHYIGDNVSRAVVLGYQYRIQAHPLQTDGAIFWLDEGMLEVPAVEQVIGRLRRGEI